MTDILSRAVSVSLSTGGVGKPKLTVEESMRVYRAAAQQGLAGSYYGYPSCCIEHFRIGPLSSLENPKELEFGLLGTGFRICPECLANRTLSDVYKQICSQRISHTPFPLAVDGDPKNLGPRFCRTIIRFIEKLQKEGTIPDPRLMENLSLWKKVVQDDKVVDAAARDPLDEWLVSY
jgi:hypothetical protein